uniref:ribosomal protein S4 n=1 Tax=Symbiochloris sp. SG-2018 TaxID=2126034 RepID=UPI0021158C19|nr:ribosomal protein S4 [Symbiochloris sp. SG-2018]UTQ75691.1 ribosomal protein S4 [Symbiochloris sp. SG-2018]
MGRYRGPRLRIIRRLGALPGLTRKTITPSSSQKQKTESPYSIRLQEKQKLRFNYGLTERQLLGYVRKAKRVKGSTGEILLQLLEMRLDNIIYRMGIAPTIPAARQFINHGHICVNNTRVNIPSYQCKPKDVISLRHKKVSQEWLAQSAAKLELVVPPHLTFNKESFVGTVNSVVPKDWLSLQIDQLLVVEYYSRRAT